MRLRLFAIGTTLAVGLAVAYAAEKTTVAPPPPAQGKAGEPMSVEETEIIAPQTSG